MIALFFRLWDYIAYPIIGAACDIWADLDEAVAG